VSRATILIAFVLLTLVSGCGRLVYTPNKQPVAAAQQQMQLIAQQSQEYQTRATSLDQDNQELESLLAQSRQKVQLLSDEISATRGQLKDTTDQLLAMRSTNSELRSKTTSLLASAQQRSGTEIRANNSLLKNLTIPEIPGVTVRQDGDVVRVEIAGDQLFMPGSPYLKDGGEQLIRSPNCGGISPTRSSASKATPTTGPPTRSSSPAIITSPRLRQLRPTTCWLSKK